MKPLASIRFGLPGALVLAVICTSALLALVTARLADARSVDLANSYGESLAAQLADMATEAVIAADLTSLAAITRRMAAIEAVAAVRIESLDGRRLAASGTADPGTVRPYLAQIAFEDTVIGRARVELRDHALALTGAGLWIAWSLLTVVLAGVAGLAGRTLSRGWLQPVEALTRLHAASVGLPVPPGGDLQAAASLLQALLDNPEPSAPPPPDTAVTVVNLFNHQSLAAAAAYQALERAATAAEQVAALYGGHLHATRNGVVLGWHASDAEHVWNGICGALLLARLLDDTPGGEFRIGVHLWSGADGLPAVVDAELVREAVALSSFAPSGQVAVSSAVMELLGMPDDRIRARAVAGTTWQALNRARHQVWVLEGLAPRFASLLERQVAHLDAAGHVSAGV